MGVVMALCSAMGPDLLPSEHGGGVLDVAQNARLVHTTLKNIYLILTTGSMELRARLVSPLP